MKHFALALTLLGMLTFAAASRADEEDCCKDGKCEGCSVAAAMAELPQMTYMVGEESTCCSASAEKMAEDSGKPVHYVVGRAAIRRSERSHDSTGRRDRKIRQ